MKYFILLNMILGLWAQFNKISTCNNIKAEAEKAYAAKDYKKAAKLYQGLVSNYHLEDENIRLNLANALFLGDDKKKASEHYQVLTNSSNAKTKSAAFQQLGLIAAMKGKYENALTNFKAALKTDPENENARYNYELIKKIREQELLFQQEELKKDQKGKDKDKTESVSGTQKERESLIKKLNAAGMRETSIGEKQKEGNINDINELGDKERKTGDKNSKSDKEEKELESHEKGNKEKEALQSKRLNEINISEEKAKAILELMKNEETQYIQEIKKHDHNKDYKNKPDW